MSYRRPSLVIPPHLDFGDDNYIYLIFMRYWCAHIATIIPTSDIRRQNGLPEITDFDPVSSSCLTQVQSPSAGELASI